MQQNLTQIIRVESFDRPTVEFEGRAHFQLPLVLAAMSARTRDGMLLPVALHSEAGIGKSTMVQQIGEVLGRKVLTFACNGFVTDSRVRGFYSAMGNWIAYEIEPIFREGGILVLEELGVLPSEAQGIFLSLVGDRRFVFQGETVLAHSDFQVVANLNTEGFGATQMYSAREKLDLALMDRFAWINMLRDPGLFAQMAYGIADVTSPELDLEEGGIPTQQELFEKIERIHENLVTEALDYHIGGRSHVFADALRNSGLGWRHVLDLAVYKGLSPEIKVKLAEGI